MYDYRYEDVAWQRLKDLQREMENSRRMADGIQRTLAAVWLLVHRAWVLAGLAMRRAPRRRPASAEAGIEDAATARNAA